jgi:hypothetical protein
MVNTAGISPLLVRSCTLSWPVIYSITQWWFYHNTTTSRCSSYSASRRPCQILHQAMFLLPIHRCQTTVVKTVEKTKAAVLQWHAVGPRYDIPYIRTTLPSQPAMSNMVSRFSSYYSEVFHGRRPFQRPHTLGSSTAVYRIQEEKQSHVDCHETWSTTVLIVLLCSRISKLRTNLATLFWYGTCIACNCTCISRVLCQPPRQCTV